MSNKDYRELQLSSSQLILIFIAILVLGIVVFLLGVSVGKKQGKIVEETQLAGKPAEQIIEQKPVPQKESGDPIGQELESHKKAGEDKVQQEKIEAEPIVKPKVEPPKPTVSSPSQNAYWIQIGAYSNQQNANKLAEEYKQKGYNAVVIEPSPSDRRKLYRVRLGGYATRALAEDARDKLAQQENKKETDYLIIR
ncbi:MAG: SPOR domain-containing protein [Candidatus Aminicenantes bacterium]|nr:MAG: SPOR domain-containing protein [Candidatus Aminicenantes bacterium]